MAEKAKTQNAQQVWELKKAGIKEKREQNKIAGKKEAMTYALGQNLGKVLSGWCPK